MADVVRLRLGRRTGGPNGTWGTNPRWIEYKVPHSDTWHSWVYITDETMEDLYREIGNYLIKKALGRA